MTNAFSNNLVLLIKFCPPKFSSTNKSVYTLYLNLKGFFDSFLISDLCNFDQLRKCRLQLLLGLLFFSVNSGFFNDV